MFTLPLLWWVLPLLQTFVLIIHAASWTYKACNSNYRPHTGLLTLEIVLVTLGWFAWAAATPATVG